MDLTSNSPADFRSALGARGGSVLVLSILVLLGLIIGPGYGAQ